MNEYLFNTVWQVAAPLAAVWDEIFHAERWPEWWPGVEAVAQLQKGDELGVGAVRRFTWKGSLPYRLTFDMRVTLVEPLKRLQGEANGELQGTGTWFFSRERGETKIRYRWRVRTTKRWMNAFAPGARPLFRWNHDRVMARGLEGLKSRLGILNQV